MSWLLSAVEMDPLSTQPFEAFCSVMSPLEVMESTAPVTMSV